MYDNFYVFMPVFTVLLHSRLTRQNSAGTVSELGNFVAIQMVLDCNSYYSMAGDCSSTTSAGPQVARRCTMNTKGMILF